MALNIKNKHVETLAADVASLAHETKTEAIRRALEERKTRLAAVATSQRSKQALVDFFERAVWPRVPPKVLAKPLSKAQRERILGYGPDGV